MTRNLYLRVFLEVPSEPEARIAAERLADATRVDVRPYIDVVRPYWKLPGTYEALLRLEPLGDALAALRNCISNLGEGWSKQPSETEMIWNRNASSTFLEQSVIWAHLELVQE